MDIRQLRYLKCIVESKSFSRAAQVLHIAQPALSLHVRKLEDELQTKLLVRHSRGIEPTAAGELLLQQANRIMEEVQRTKDLFRARSANIG
ncbi:MAG: LysR family transcriptional regulator [Rhizobiales bacterium]|nr:LysR family transcriptional regulator [Hyphomicrobiales bacterium]